MKKSLENHWGPVSAPVTIIEYIDYQCPYSAGAEEPIRQVIEAYENEVCWIVRQYPLSDIHDWAWTEAVAAEAAALQGKFWEMHQALFANQNQLDLDAIFDIAENVGLDVEQFRSDLEGEECRDRVRRDVALGDSEGVAETPTLFVNGRKLEQGVSFTNLSRAVAGWLEADAA